MHKKKIEFKRKQHKGKKQNPKNLQEKIEKKQRKNLQKSLAKHHVLLLAQHFLGSGFSAGGYVSAEKMVQTLTEKTCMWALNATDRHKR